MKSTVLKYMITVIGSLIIAISFNVFLLPHGVLSSGISGLALLFHILFNIDTGLLNILLNLPLLILGYMKLQKSMMWNTIFCVIMVSVFLSIVPVIQVSDNPLLDVVFGGVILGIGIGIILKFSGTTGGMDIIAILISQRSNVPIGLILTLLNGIIVLSSGYFFDWGIALLTLLSIYISGKTIDTIYTSHIKLTVNIVTTQGEAIKAALIDNIYRGMTIMDAHGGYSNEPRQVIMMVLTRYELKDVIQICKAIDGDSFIHVYETTEVHGNFAHNHP
ncbi:YitT family protein [Macrococcus equipercicus]|uniref:YitT family protein n=1 Tax=Macrococcus equipercicus TaxID=69967 RepID=A0ABQ6R8X0_9STAP|nr:YitT family protein [Macrococcus equipercicus]KAA1039600.1 YitT family protein [Macrococcus equipercicus]